MGVLHVLRKAVEEYIQVLYDLSEKAIVRYIICILRAYALKIVQVGLSMANRYTSSTTNTAIHACLPPITAACR